MGNQINKRSTREYRRGNQINKR